MPIASSVGYAGEIDDEQWAKNIWRLGAGQYGVGGTDQCRVTAAPGTRTVAIAAGTAWGKGIADAVLADTISLPSVPTGVRYDLIVVRRNWSTGLTTLGYVAGGSTKALPSRATAAGTGIDEQPLALVEVRAGSTAIHSVTDVRVWPGNGGNIADSDLVMQYISTLGTTIWINGHLWVRDMVSQSPRWRDIDLSDTGYVTEGIGFSVNSDGWSIESYRFRRLMGSIIRGRVVVERSKTANIPAMNTKGEFNESPILRLPTGWRSRTAETIPMRGASQDTPFFAAMDNEGLVSVRQGLPGSPLVKGGTYVLTFDHWAD